MQATPADSGKQSTNDPEINDAETNIVLVFGGGSAPTAADRARLPQADLVIAADGGVDHALACDLPIDIVVGDLDSVTDAGLAAATSGGAIIERHDREKDASDLELALRRAAASRPTRIVITAVSGGRTDHLLVNMLLAGSAQFDMVDVDIVSGSDRMSIVRDRREFDVVAGQLVSLVPLHGKAGGVTTSGLRYRLDNESLEAGSSRGLSNVAVSAMITVEVRSGILLVVIPDPELP